jgi:hypothetical protein
MAVRMSVGCKSICIPFSEHLIDWFHIIMECASLWNVSCSWRAHVPDYQVVLVDERSDFFP